MTRRNVIKFGFRSQQSLFCLCDSPFLIIFPKNALVVQLEKFGGSQVSKLDNILVMKSVSCVAQLSLEKLSISLVAVRAQNVHGY